MVIDYIVLKDHSVKWGNRCLGVKGDHLTNSLRVSLADCGFEFVTAKIHFSKQSGEDECTEDLSVNAEQIVEYPLPHSLFMVDGNVDISVSAETAEGEVITSVSTRYVVLDSVHGTKPIEDKITALEAEVEELKKKLYKNSVLGICELNYMILGMEA